MIILGIMGWVTKGDTKGDKESNFLYVVKYSGIVIYSNILDAG